MLCECTLTSYLRPFICFIERMNAHWNKLCDDLLKYSSCVCWDLILGIIVSKDCANFIGEILLLYYFMFINKHKDSARPKSGVHAFWLCHVSSSVRMRAFQRYTYMTCLYRHVIIIPLESSESQLSILAEVHDRVFVYMVAASLKHESTQQQNLSIGKILLLYYFVFINEHVSTRQQKISIEFGSVVQPLYSAWLRP